MRSELPTRGGRRRPSLRADLVRILCRSPRGATTVALAKVLAARGDPRVQLDKRDHTNAIRTALMTARRNGQVFKGEGGRWRVVMSPPDYTYSRAIFRMKGSGPRKG